MSFFDYLILLSAKTLLSLRLVFRFISGTKLGRIHFNHIGENPKALFSLAEKNLPDTGLRPFLDNSDFVFSLFFSTIVVVDTEFVPCVFLFGIKMLF